MTNALDGARLGPASCDPWLRAADIHLFETEEGPHLLLVDGSQLFKIDEDLKSQLTAAAAEGKETVRAVLAA